jgi:protein-L-isoaspartate(D-aspartate) O-methyltransferase
MDNFSRVRDRMIEDELVQRGIRDKRVIEAVRKIPRHLFAPQEFGYRGYEGRSLPIGSDQTISQPFIVAFMTEQLLLDKSLRVLEIGTGSGYQTALLAELSGEVYTIERHENLQRQARQALSRLLYRNIHYHTGDGFQGWPAEMKFDRIIITAAATEIPHLLLAQLGDAGRLVTPIDESGRQRLVLAVKINGRLRRRYLINCDFVPMVRGTMSAKQ